MFHTAKILFGWILMFMIAAALAQGSAHAAMIAERLDAMTGTASGSRIERVEPLTLTMFGKLGAVSYTENVRTSRTYKLHTFRLIGVLMTTSEAMRRVDADLDELRAVLTGGCSDIGGKLQRAPGARADSYDNVMRVWVDHLERNGRVGLFRCVAGESSKFEVLIEGGFEARSRVLPVGFDWPISVKLLEAEQCDGFEGRRLAYLARTQALRATLAAATEVQVRGRALDAKAPGLEHANAQFVCARIVERQGGVVVVQVRSTMATVAVDDVFPLYDGPVEEPATAPNVRWCRS